jgi:hypothetical protein
MTKSFDSSVPSPDSETALTHAQLRCVKALFKIDDPEPEQALALIIERLAANQPAGSLPPSDGPQPEPLRE